MAVDIQTANPPRTPKPGYIWKIIENKWVEVVNPKTQNYVSIISIPESTYATYTGNASWQAGELDFLFQAEVKSTLLSRSTYKITDLIGEGPISGFFPNTGAYGSDPLTSTYFDGVRVRNFDGSYNFNLTGVAEKNGNDAFEFNYTLGTSGQLEISGYSKNETFITIPSNTRVAKMPPGVGGSKDVIVNLLKKEFPDTVGLKITFRVPALFNMANDGKKSGLQILYSIKGSKDDGPEFDLLPLRNVVTYDIANQKVILAKKFGVIAGIANSTYLTTKNIFHISLAENWTTYRLRIVRENENAVSDRMPSELFVDSIAVIGNNRFSYPNSVLAAMSINSDNFSQIPARAYDILGLLISIPQGYTPPRINGNGSYSSAIYPAIWTGTFSSQKQWTNNPAWILYDIITNKRYGLGNYLNEDLIDKWSIYEIAKYCDEMVSDGKGGMEPRFTCNAVIQGAKAAYDLLQDLVSVFQGMTYWGNGKIWVNTSKLYPTVYNFTNANVIEGRFLYADTAKNTRSTVVKVKWRDPDLLYREDIVSIEDVNGIQKYGYIEKEIESFGCTSRGQAIRSAEFILQSERNLTETVTFQTALEGLYIRPGDNFNIYDNFVNNKNQGGRILSISSGNKLIELDRSISINSQRTYELSLINPVFNIDSPTGITGSNQFDLIRNSQIEKRNIQSYDSGSSLVTVSSAFSNGVQNGGIWMLNCTSTGEYNESSRLFRCLASAEIQPGIIEILGVETNTGIAYSSSTGYSSENIFYEQPVLQPINPPSGLNVSIYSGINNGAFQYDPLLTWSGSNSSNVAGYIISGKIASGSFYDIAETTNISYLADFSNSGFYQYRVAAVSNEGAYSSFITGGILFSTTTNPLGGPPIISGVVIENQDTNGSYGTTGYVGRDVLFSWELEIGDNGYYSPKTVFFSGYQVSILNPTTSAVLLTENITNIGNRIYYATSDLLTGLGLSGRLVKTRIVVVDRFGGKTTPVDTSFNNPPPRTPTNSGFYQMPGGLQFNIQKDSLDVDISGCYLWVNTSSSFTPTFSNPTKTFSVTEGFLQNSFTSDFYTWFSLIDTFGTTGSTIYGPVFVSSAIPLVTGIASSNSPMLKGGVNISGVGGVKVTQSEVTNTILISGERPFFNLGFFLTEMPDETGVAIGELISSRPFIFTGYSVSCRTVGSSNLSGSFYYCGLDNASTVSLGDFGLVAGQTNRTQGLPFANVPASRKIGYNLTSLANTSEKVSIGLFGYEVT
jgi:predicted phage tail protein